jgi:hypothetical protein
MATVQIPKRRVIFSAAVAVVLGLVPMVTLFAVPSAPHAIAQDECTGTDTTDNYSMQCIPTIVPDSSDQLTEADVAAPGYNASNPGGGGDDGGFAGGGGFAPRGGGGGHR